MNVQDGTQKQVLPIVLPMELENEKLINNIYS